MKNRIEELFAGYINNSLTEAERLEFMKLINAKQHSDEVKGMIDSMFKQEYPGEDMPLRAANETLQNILQQQDENAERSRRSKIVQMNPTNPWKWVAAAAVIVMVAGAGWYIAKSQLGNQQLSYQDTIQNIALSEQLPQATVYKGKQLVRLPDKSTVLLNDNSELIVSAAFNGTLRAVTLKGEGYFDIAHNAEKPFKVITGEVITTVLGTAFNVKAYEGTSEVKVTVTRGKVQVGDLNEVYGLITPDQQIAVNTETHYFTQRAVKAETATAWKADYLIFTNTTLEDAAALIEEKYHVQIDFANNALRRCDFNATFLNDENIDQVIAVLSAVTDTEITRKADGSFSIAGEGCGKGF